MLISTTPLIPVSTPTKLLASQQQTKQSVFYLTIPLGPYSSYNIHIKCNAIKYNSRRSNRTEEQIMKNKPSNRVRTRHVLLSPRYYPKVENKNQTFDISMPHYAALST